MSTLTGLLQIGADALQINQTEISVHGNNVANARTPGFSRRDVLVNEGPGPTAGGGVRAQDVTRAEDFILMQKLAAQGGDLADATLTATALQEIEKAIQAGQDSLSQKVTDLGTAFSQLGAKPADPILRTDTIAKGQAVAAEFQRVSSVLSRLQTQNRDDAQGLLGQVNDLASQVAALNEKVLAGGPALEQATQDSRNLDLRDQAAQDLAALTGGQLLRNQDGSLDVLVGGVSLVHGTVAEQMAISDPGGGGKLGVTVGGQVVQGPAGGKIGGYITAHDTAASMLGQFDRLAFDLSSALNAQHAFGVGLDGVSGRPFFAKLAGPAGAAASLKLDGALTPDTLAAGFTKDPGDNRNAAALSNLIDQPVLEGGKSTFQNVYSRIISDLGFGVQKAQAAQQLAQGQSDALSAARATLTGVSTDEEMTKLVAYQQGFEAGARFIKAIEDMMTTFMTNV